MQRIADPETSKMSPLRAESILTKYCHYEGERTLRPRLINHYANEIRNDEFYTPVIMLAERAYNGGEVVCLNGHHTLNSIIQTNKPAWVTIERWRVEDPIEEGELYGKFDGLGFRYQSDFVKAMSASLKLEWPQFVCRAVVSAASLKEGKEHTIYSNDRAKLLKNYLDEGAFFNRILNSGIPDGAPKTVIKHMKRKGVYYPMLITWEKCHKDAEVFWSDVRDGEGLRRTMPQYLLRDFLLTHSIGFSYSTHARNSVSYHEMAARCITAWNIFRKKHRAKVLKYYPTKPMPKPV